MFKRHRHEVPELSTTSTADISFMLLIFFLVTSSMDTDKGLARQLPMPDDETVQQQVLIKERNVLAVELDANDRMTCDGEPVSAEELTQRVEEFVANRNGDPQMPEMSERDVHLLGRYTVSDRHVITIKVHPNTTYNAYFDMQDAIVRGYNNLRNQLARRHFNHSLAQCTNDERDAIVMVYPQRISELPMDDETHTTADEPQQKGGEP